MKLHTSFVRLLSVTITIFSVSVMLLGCKTIKDEGLVSGNEVKLTDQMRIGEYLIRTFRAEDGAGWAEISKAGKVTYRRDGYVFQIGAMPDATEHDYRRWMGKDITGSGKPAVILYEWTGGAHGFYNAFVVELDTPIVGVTTPCKEVAEIKGYYSVPQFADLNGDGRPELIIQDWSYAYWPDSFAESPAPQVILTWRNGHYVVAPELMKKPEPTPQELQALAKKVRAEWAVIAKSQGGESMLYSHALIPPDLFCVALDLMYSGHENLGWQLISMAWDPKHPMDAALINELKERMRNSEWW